MEVAQLARFVNIGRKIVGVGLNYRSLIHERNLQAPDNPIIFLKPTSSYISEGQTIEIPDGFVVNQETELGVIVGKTCRNVNEDEAKKAIGGYCLALDMTEVKHLTAWRKQGMPWSLSKGFDTSCPVSRFVAPEELPDPDNVNLWCKINGKVCQKGNTSDMLFAVPTIISYVSKMMTLEPGDLILTGSPPGMVDVKAGDVIEAGLGDILSMKFPVADRK